MPCNMLTVQTLEVLDEALTRLLTPEHVLAAVKAALADLGLTPTFENIHQSGLVNVQVPLDYSGYAIRVRGGAVAVTGRSSEQADKLGKAVGGVMKALGLALLAQNIATSLTNISGVTPEIEDVAMELDGRVFQARRLTVTW